MHYIGGKAYEKNSSFILTVLSAMFLLLISGCADPETGSSVPSSVNDTSVSAESDSGEVNDVLSTEERREEYALSQETIESMTTEELLKTILDNPFFADIWAFKTADNNYDVGIEIALENIDGLKALTEREDFSDELQTLKDKASQETGEDVELYLLKVDLMYEVLAFTQK